MTDSSNTCVALFIYWRLKYRVMAKIREIRNRIKAVGNIQRITRTMQLIATARFQVAQRRALATQPYSQKISEMVSELAGGLSGGSGDEGLAHPLLRPITDENRTGRELLLVITSNRGLCGGYNGGVLRTMVGVLRANSDKQIDLEMVGKKGVSYTRFNEIEVSTVHSQFGDTPTFEEVDLLAKRYMQVFADGTYDAVRIVFMSFQSTARQAPKVLQLLPMTDPTAEAGAGDGGNKGEVGYDFSPDPEKLLAELLPVTIKTQLFQCFNEAVVSEQVARMIAMKAATDAGERMGRELAQKFNRARQAAITTELTEIISGVAALE